MPDWLSSVQFLEYQSKYEIQYSLEELRNILLENKNFVRKIDAKKNWYKACELLYHTKLLIDARFNQRIFHIINNMEKYITCSICNVSNLSWNNDKVMYNKTCSSSSCINAISKTNYINTMLERHGVTNFFATDEFKIDIKHHNQEKYGTDQYVQSLEFKEKYKSHMQNTYGVDHYLQNDDKLNAVHKALIQRDGKLPSQKHISDEVLDVLNDRDWLIDQHHIQQKTLRRISEELGVERTTIQIRMDALGVSLKRHPISMAEKDLSDFLTSHNITFENNTRSIIPPLELDIYIPDYNLAIEQCGLYWHSEAVQEKAKTLHKTKYDLCKERGIRLLTIFSHEWEDNRDIIQNKILYLLNKNTKSIYARKTTIVEVDRAAKSKFFDKYHIQGNGPSSINYGLMFDGEIVAVIGFIQQKDGFILNRYATVCSVVGGFSKLLTKFEKTYSYPKITTFADLRWSEGDLYKNTGFILDKELNPDYYWIKGKNIWHKFNFRHIHMAKKLDNYNPSLSESINMHNNGYFRIWDCGKLRFVKNTEKKNPT